MNTYLILIITVLIAEYTLGAFSGVLNIKNAGNPIPGEFKDICTEEQHKKSQSYLKTNTLFSLFEQAVVLALLIAAILLGGFNGLDLWIRKAGAGTVGTGVLFGAAIMVVMQVVHLPFSIYRTFVIEEKFGFNRTTPKTFALDIVKSLFLTAAIAAPVFAFIIYLLEFMGPYAWLYCWGALSAFQLFLFFFAPVLIMPLFNKFTPLEDGKLKSMIEEYAKRQDFRLSGIFTMDGSKRSAKTNAYFTGLGKFKRIVFFDTLLEKHSPEETMAVLAHEMGHYKKGHIRKMLAVSFLTSGLMFGVMAFFINSPGLFAAFSMQHMSVYAGMIFFMFLYSPVEFFISIAAKKLSRKHEYEADAYALETYRDKESIVSLLKKLSVTNLSNLNPHPLKVFLSYTHPPVLARIRAIEKLAAKNTPV